MHGDAKNGRVMIGRNQVKINTPVGWQCHIILVSGHEPRKPTWDSGASPTAFAVCYYQFKNISGIQPNGHPARRKAIGVPLHQSKHRPPLSLFASHPAIFRRCMELQPVS